MVLQKKFEPPDIPTMTDSKNDATKNATSPEIASIKERLEELEALPRRNPLLHWIAFVLSLISLVLLSAWVFSSRGPVPINWVVFDIGLAMVIVVEFFTGSGFHWNHRLIFAYPLFRFRRCNTSLGACQSRDSIRIDLGMDYHGCQAARAIDRLLGDGFVQRNIWGMNRRG